MQKNATEAVAIRVTTRARADEIGGWRGDTLLVRVKAPPIDGRANDAVRRLLARAVGVGPNEIEIVGGLSSRDKIVRLPKSALATLHRSG
ncbi:MAG TPA: DUF167 domain-containing protein [Dehalococcoidia bacterium]|nr:DUF167 domain-containing protein [Dehalococcoidia bacterium]